jgi:iron complex outermembrane recepter protein
MNHTHSLKFLATSALATWAVLVPVSAVHAQDVAPATAQTASTELEAVVITGSRIPRRELEGISPVAVTTGEQIKLGRAVTIEDFSVKLPQLAGGVNAAATGSDGFGAQTLDLRNLGQNRTLVLINGTRATPFSFRNAVDVNSIPAPLLKRVDVLTGGAAAVYGADAVAGVVNFVIDDEYDGLAVSGNYRVGDGGGDQYGANVTFGTELGDRGHIAAYAEYTQREALRVGARDYALVNPVRVAGTGGNFRDVASGRVFSFDEAGAFTLTPQTSNFTPQFFVIQPLKRINGSLFFKYDLTDSIEAYGRGMYTNVKTTGSSRAGSQPLIINETVGIDATNTFIPTAARNLLTFVNGVAQVNVNRTLGEIGIVTARTTRDSYQGQIGLRGDVTSNIKWDTYFQYGQVKENTILNVRRNATTFASLANSVNIFAPNATGLTALSTPGEQNRRDRKQLNAAITLAGTTEGIFELPAGPIGFAIGVEYRQDKGENIDTNNAGVPVPARFFGKQIAKEAYGELVVPLLSDLPLIQKLEFEGAYRISDYTRSGSNGSGKIGSFGTSKLGASWTVTDDLRFRGARQTVIRAPNLGETEGAIASIPFSALRTVARLNPRYLGDPCALGTGNAAQCTAQGYKGTYDSLNPANLTGGYFFGGNAGIKPEKGTTYTVGAVLTPTFVPGFSATVDYYRIDLKDAVGQIQPVDALNSCYITNPVASNPLCLAVTRDAVTGRIKDGFPVDRNLASIKQRGFDVGVTYARDVPEGLPGKKFTVSYQANIVTGYSIQRNAVLAAVDCKGRYGFACSSDAVSLVAADYKHRLSLNWAFNAVTTQIGWQRIGEVRDSALGSNDKISGQNYIDLAVSITPTDWATINVGVDNLLDQRPPLPRNPGAFNTYPDTYNVLGRSAGISVTFKN